MGYRSDVLSAIVFEDAAHNTTAMVAWKLHCAAEGKADPLDKEHFGENVTFPKVGKHPSILLRGEGWKWYDTYPDVQAWHYFIDWMAEQHQCVSVFLRLGEESEDIQENWNESQRGSLTDFYAWDYFGITRSIRCEVEEG